MIIDRAQQSHKDEIEQAAASEYNRDYLIEW